MKYTILNQKGAAVVEFAVIASILFVILFAILEFGFIFMQEHYVANATREGVRVGIRANNFNCFESPSECSSVPPAQRVFRKQFIQSSLRGTDDRDGYLSALYGRNNPEVTVNVNRDESVPNKKTIIVSVTAPNIFPSILSSLISLLPGTGFTLPETFSFTATGEYEDPDEP